MSDTTRACLFVRGPDTIRIVIGRTSVAVYGPGTGVESRAFGDEMGATFYQAELEQALVLEGWRLEQLTTERRSTQRDLRAVRPERRALRLVPHPHESIS